MAGRNQINLPAGVFIVDTDANGDYLNGRKAQPPGAPSIGRMARLIALVLVVVVVVVILTGINQFGQWLLLGQRGAAAQGRITEKITLNTSGGPEYNLVYVFRAEDGRDWTGTVNVTVGEYKMVTIGQNVSVVYLRDSPTTSRIGTPGDPLPGDLTARLAGAGAAFLGAVGALLAGVRQGQAASKAQAVTGRVVRAEPGGALEYAFVSPGSRQNITGRAALGEKGLKNVRPAPGQPVMVYWVNDNNHWAL